MSGLSTRLTARITLGLAALASGLMLAACEPAGTPEGASAKGTVPARPAMPVSVLVVQPQAVPLLIDTVAQSEGSKEVAVRARVTGIVEEILFSEGSRVEAGTPLYQIERAPFEIALSQAEAAAAQEQARLSQARRELDRLRKLAAQRVVSRRDLDAAGSAAATAAAAFKVAQARVDDAQLNLSRTRIVAPIAGVTGQSQKSQGALVTANGEGALTTLVQADPIWVRFALSQDQYNRMRGHDGAQVRIFDSTGTDLDMQGQVNFSGSVIDPRIGTVSMRAGFPNPDLMVLPGQFLKVQVRVGERQAYRVPQAAVVQSPQGRIVFVVDTDNKAQPRPVKTAEWLDSDWVIEEGLQPGDKVIVDNLIKVRPGAPVAPREPGQKDAPPAGKKPGA